MFFSSRPIMFLTPQVRSRIRQINRQIAELRQAQHEALLAGAQSASQSSAGASQSYQRFSPREYREQIESLLRERSQLLAGGTRRRTSPDFG